MNPSKVGNSGPLELSRPYHGGRRPQARSKTPAPFFLLTKPWVEPNVCTPIPVGAVPVTVGRPGPLLQPHEESGPKPLTSGVGGVHGAGARGPPTPTTWAMAARLWTHCS